MKKVVFLLLFPALLSACGEGSISKRGSEEKIKRITLTFAGDIMAHTPNFMMRDYSEIYENLADILLTDDLSFANFETPVCDSLPLSTYPRFNVHTPYLEAAIKGGFEVFSLANNHTNDQGKEGIRGTFGAVKRMEEKYNAENNAVYFSGLKQNDEEEWQCTVIHKNDFRVAFLAVTEILNSADESRFLFYYSPPSEKGRQKLLERIKTMRAIVKPDIFVLSLHVNEAEYIRDVSAEKKEWFLSLADAGADIVWANHPHVMQPWEKAERKTTTECSAGEREMQRNKKDGENYENTTKTAFFMYSMGNFISAQRYKLNYEDPASYMEYTGDAVLLQLTYTKKNGRMQDDFTVTPVPITVYKTAGAPVLRRLNREFIESLSSERDKKYYSARLELMKAYLPSEIN